MIAKYKPTYSLGAAILLAGDWRNRQSALQDELASLFGVRHVILFQSGRHALYALLRALGREGEVVLPAYNCIAVPDAVTWAGWHPRLADIAPGNVNMSCNEIDAKCTGNTRAVIMTHQFGIPADVESIMAYCRQRRLFVIEDAAAAFGARCQGRLVGTFGDAAILSFHLTKVVNAGRCGVLLTQHDYVADAVKSAAGNNDGLTESIVDAAYAAAWAFAMQHGVYGLARSVRGFLTEDPMNEYVAPTPMPRTLSGGCSGYVARLVHHQLQSLEGNLQARQNLARIYAQGLQDLSFVQTCRVAEWAAPAWIQYPVFVHDKAACYRYFLRHGVDLSWTFRYSCGASYGSKDTPNAERAARTILGLPTYPVLDPADAHRICALFREFGEQ